jgi:ribonuclease R
VLEEAREAGRGYDPQRAAHGREDLRGRIAITIDPVNARDFDDAITLDENHGQSELGVHIADVSHFVRPGTALDDEARERANSVYFPQYVVPMLPEVLSNGVCSLQEGQPRLTKSAFITYDRQGKVLRTRFANSVISSTKRLTYEEATKILEGKIGGYPKAVVQLLRRMDELARIIRERRLREGMIVLDLPEVELVFDELARVTGVVPEDMSFSHTIIEMFMVEANEAVARLFVKLGVPHLRRAHEEPDDATLEGLTRFLKAIGQKVPKRIDRAWLQRLLEGVKGAPESFAVNMAVLRSMQRAEYRPDLIGHYALASEDYLHFTSPIRRYPDLVDHRLLEAYLAGKFEHKKKPRAETPTWEELRELGVHCSTSERRAEAAERELKLVKVLQLLESHLGEEFDGIVTGVAQFGVFIQLRDYLVDGLLRYADLADDWWDVDVEGGFVIGERTGRRIGIGQQLRVAISRIDIPNRTLDLALAEGRPASKSSEPRRMPARRRGKQRPARAPHGAVGRPKRERAARGRRRR